MKQASHPYEVFEAVYNLDNLTLRSDGFRIRVSNNNRINS